MVASRVLLSRREPPVLLRRSRNRSSRWSSICAGLSERTRAAASSIASGIPSSRRTISAIVATIPVVQLEPRVGGDGPLGEQPGGGGGRPVRVERRHRFAVLAVDAERLPARGEHAQRGRGVEQVLDERRGRVDEVLAVVDDEQRRSAGPGGSRCVASGALVRDRRRPRCRSGTT